MDVDQVCENILLFTKQTTKNTINRAKKENNIKFNIKLKLPFLSSLSSLAYLEKSPKLKITKEKYAKIELVTVIKGPKLFSCEPLFLLLFSSLFLAKWSKIL